MLKGSFRPITSLTFFTWSRFNIHLHVILLPSIRFVYFSSSVYNTNKTRKAQAHPSHRVWGLFKFVELLSSVRCTDHSDEISSETRKTCKLLGSLDGLMPPYYRVFSANIILREYFIRANV
jgi:hypothetical protein